MRNELIAFVHGHSATFTSTASGGMHRWSDPAQTFHAFISGLPETATPDAQQLESRVVFRNVTKLPLLSKAAIKACIGGFAFFGDLLQWCAPLSQHALVVFPEYEFSPKPATGATTWTKPSTAWTSYAGQQRDLLYVDGGDISYAGTFFCHGGPRAVKLAELGEIVGEAMYEHLARRTLVADTKRPKDRSNLIKTFVPSLTNLYREGSATVQVLGLQRVGFNQSLFGILIKASKKRERAAALLELLGETSPVGDPGTPKKRGLPEEDAEAMEAEIDMQADGRGGEGPGPSKIPKLGELVGLADTTAMWDM
ncbi:hypothetical protein DICSQDRAFT_141442 [Dichomitus squalens LYAD-421 SS1]|uniref:Uncharacterized protein n=1 Tax=Dichomitus squalens (strain LYAD-421) TaxID=732165 RepID=R7SMH9_DICSQ|nr:uncharacterized protein DICSQDRAFT_141442 [Dichomitus squalens LYAD-421 SS1]EJF56182.1 hypothetical protein DICSQDRAFT_141442 [Dichomitus squalens LYAD-421 SS1]